MNFLLPLLSFFLGGAKDLFQKPGAALSQQLVLHVRALSVVAVTVVGSLALFCVGLSLFISQVVGQLDGKLETLEGFAFSIGMMVYLGMTVASLAVLLFSLSQQRWLRAVGFRQTASPSMKKSGPLESAVALLVVDFVEERQRRREQPKQTEV